MPILQFCSMSTTIVNLHFYCNPSIAPGRLRSPLTLPLSLARHSMARKPPGAAAPFARGQAMDASLEPVHLDHPPHFTGHPRARAARLDTEEPPPKATAMPQKDMTRRKDADRLRRPTPRLAFTARPEPRHDLRSLLDKPSGRRSTTSSRARRSRPSAMTTSTRRTPLC